jgi:serine protease Do
VITKVGGKPVEHADDLSEVIADYDPGEDVELEIHRGGDTKTVTVKLGERPVSGISG